MKHQEEVIIQRVAGMEGVTTVMGHSVCNDFQRHIHRMACIGLVKEGTRRLQIRGQEYVLNAGDLFCINRGEVHRCSSVGPHSYAVILLELGWMEHISAHSSGGMRNLFAEPAIYNDAKLTSQFKGLFDALNAEESLAETSALFLTFFETLQRRYSEPNELDEPMPDFTQITQGLCAYMDANVRQNLSIEMLSEWVHISPFHLNRLFRKSLGISLHEYMIFQKIDESRKLLRQGVPLAVVAAELGFSDQSHFTRCFHSIVGTSPGRFTRSNRSE